MTYPLVSKVVQSVNGLTDRESRMTIARQLLAAAHSNSELRFSSDDDAVLRLGVQLRKLGALSDARCGHYHLTPEVARPLREFDISHEGYLSGSVRVPRT